MNIVGKIIAGGLTCLVCVVFYSPAKADMDGLANEVAALWLQANHEAGNSKKNRCWKKSKGNEIQQAFQLLKEIEVGWWLLEANRSKSKSRYEVLYALSLRGLERRMGNNGYSLAAMQGQDDFWTVRTYSNSSEEQLSFSYLEPKAVQSILDGQEHELFEVIATALAACKAQGASSVASMTLLVYLALPFMSQDSIQRIVNELIITYQQGIGSDQKARLLALGRLGQIMVVLSPRQRASIAKNFPATIKEQLLQDIDRRTQKMLSKKKQSQWLTLFKLWRYIALQQTLDSVEVDALQKKIATLKGVDPQLSFSLLDTINYLLLAKDLGWSGNLDEAATIIRTMILFEIGTANTGLNLTRPINRKNIVITPYPLWLALVPSYSELMRFMENSSGQLTAESYKNSRTFSRDQYVSGVVEKGFWQLFENVVN